MPCFSFCSRGEKLLRQFGRILQPPGEVDTANRLALFIFFPAGTRQVTANDAFDRKGLRFLYDHAPTGELILKRFKLRRKRIACLSESVVWDNVFNVVEPKMRQLSEHFSFSGNTVR